LARLKAHIETDHVQVRNQVLNHAGYDRVKAAIAAVLKEQTKVSVAEMARRAAALKNVKLEALRAIDALCCIVSAQSFRSRDHVLLQLRDKYLVTRSGAPWVSPNRKVVAQYVQFFWNIAKRENIDLFTRLGSAASCKDTWSSNGQDRLSVLTLRAVDELFCPVSRPIWMGNLAGEHSAVRESNALQATIDEFFPGANFVHVAQVSDGAALAVGRALVRGENTLWCAAHLGSLAGEKFAEVYKALSAAIGRIRGVLSLIKKSPMLTEALHERCVKMDVKPRKVKLDVPTRWSSKFAMLERFLELVEPIEAMYGTEIIFKDGETGVSVKPSADDVGLVREAKAALKVLSEFTKLVSGTTYTSVTHVPSWVQDMYTKLASCGDAGKELLKCLKHYFDPWVTVQGADVDAVPLPLRACCFDPRHAALPTVDADAKDLVWAAAKKDAAGILGPDVQQALVDGLMAQLRVNITSGDYDSCAGFWLAPASSLLAPLRPVARAMLSVPAASVDPERAFSTAGLFDSDLRGAMDASTLAKCVIISHWLASYLTRVPVVHRQQPSTASAATDALGGRDSYRFVMKPDDEERLMKVVMDALSPPPSHAVDSSAASSSAAAV
jgi:hypothetical protein